MAISHRRANLAQVLIALGCSPAVPSTDVGSIQGVEAIEQVQCEGFCPEENVEGATIAQGAVWLTRTKQTSPDNGQTIVSSAEFGVVTFGEDGGIAILGMSPNVTGGCCSGPTGVSSGVGVTPDGSNVYFAYDDKGTAQTIVQNGVDGGTRPAGQDGIVLGVAAQTEGAVVAVLPSCCGNGCSSNCYGGGGLDVGGNSSFNVDQGNSDAGAVLYGLNFADGGVTPKSIGVDVDVSTHLFAGDGSTVYWIGGGTVWSLPADDLSASPTSVGPVSGVPVALSVFGGVAAWTTIVGTSNCNNGTCIYAPQSYAVSTSTNGVIYQAQSTQQFALGLAIDGSNAYFAIVEQRTTTNCCNGQDGGLNINHDIYTTGIARLSLTGGASQTPSVIPFDTDRMFGPRRFFADAQYVYGIDPAYVLRIAKSAFP